jgi:DNA polymerase III sliding clamp (beta) subunit (PCNA family)
MQEIILPVSELKKALTGLNKIVAKKSPLPIFQSVRVARDANGQLSILATDLDSFATYNFQQTQPGPAMAVLVPFDQLTRIVKGMKAEETISLIPEGKETIKLRYFIAGCLVEQNLSTWPVDEFPRVPEVNQPSIPLEPEFGTTLRQALECCSDDPARRNLNGACLDVTDKQFHYVIGTNGRVLFSANSFGFDLQKSVIIPDSKFLAWTDFMVEVPGLLSVEPSQAAQPAKDGQPAKGARPGYVKLQSGPWTLITEEIEGKFPDWKQALPTPNANWTRVDLSGEAMKQLLLVTPILPGDDQPNRPIRLRVDRYLTIEGQNQNDEEWTSIPVQTVNITGGPVSIALNREYLLKALRFGLHELEIKDALNPVVFSNATSGKTMIIVPLNLDEGKVTGQVAAQSSSETPPPPAQPTTSEEQPAPITEVM